MYVCSLFTLIYCGLYCTTNIPIIYVFKSNFPDEKIHKRLHSLIFLRHFLNDSDRIVLKLTGFVLWTCDPNSRATDGG